MRGVGAKEVGVRGKRVRGMGVRTWIIKRQESRKTWSCKVSRCSMQAVFSRSIQRSCVASASRSLLSRTVDLYTPYIACSTLWKVYSVSYVVLLMSPMFREPPTNGIRPTFAKHALCPNAYSVQISLFCHSCHHPRLPSESTTRRLPPSFNALLPTHVKSISQVDRHILGPLELPFPRQYVVPLTCRAAPRVPLQIPLPLTNIPLLIPNIPYLRMLDIIIQIRQRVQRVVK